MRFLVALLLIQVIYYAYGFTRPASNIITTSANLERILQPKPRRPCISGEKWPKSPSPDSTEQKFTRLEAKDFMRLQGRVLRLENLVHDLCGAIVYSDDMALMEREILRSGPIYLDPNNETNRPPILLRREIADVAWRHGKPVSPPAHKWH